MKNSNPNPKPSPMPKPKPKPKPVPKPSSKASSSSSSAAAAAAAAEPHQHRNPPAAVSTPPKPAAAAGPLPPPRPLITVAAVEAAMASLPPPPPYVLESLERRTISLSDGTVRSYFVLPPDRPPLPHPHHPLVPPPFSRHGGPPGPPADRWGPQAAPSGPTPPKRKWEERSNGAHSGEPSDRQKQAKAEAGQEEKPAAKQAAVVDEKALKSSFLKMVKRINENAELKNNYRANGKVKCLVCGRDSVDLHSLLNHAYNAKNAELRADHLGLHKAVCVLMGWNCSVDPVHKKDYQALSIADAEANRGDLILWPPTVILENTYQLKKNGLREGIGNKDMESKLREMGYPGAKAKALYGKDGPREVILVQFASSPAGLSEAVRLAEFFENDGRGRAGWTRAQNTPPNADGNKPLLMRLNVKGERSWILYGYLATAWDLDLLDVESKENAAIWSRKEPDLSK